MQNLLLFFLLAFLLAACSNETPAITKVESDETNKEQSPVLIEKEKESKSDEEVERSIEFNLPKEQVLINLDQVTILKQYLAGITNKRFEINQMQLSQVLDFESLYLLRFSCRQDTCSYLLLDQDGDGRSFLLEDLTKLDKIQTSSDKEKLLFTFNRVEDEIENPSTKLLVMDLASWKPVPLVNEQFNGNLNTYQTNIANAEWKNDNTLSIKLENTAVAPPKENNKTEDGTTIEINLENMK
ncbi:hypothetical protein [Aquibacillus salsiterrae]|uniref:DUF5068 domain-containing protein n=1 Tax=Aquibacillus salsiterrae TaxID=2950439 RepID=A0A9X4AFT6_9BACI|nr:hypothetical protein [Aquibacillus salsiterrae]MDC3416560.1 hypothetical protein [Aquibacillus salsiterrae]